MPLIEALLMSTHNVCLTSTSDEYSQHMFLWRNKKNSYFSTKTCCGYSLEAPL